MREMRILDDLGIGVPKLPKYDFQCLKCKSLVELQASIYDPIEEQPKCSKCHELMVRIYSVPAAIFRGTGWGKDKK